MKLLLRYLRSCAVPLALLLVFLGINWLVLRLYQAPAEAALYAAVLCFVVVFVFFFVRFWRFRRQYRMLQELARHAALPSELPPVRDALDATYQQLVQTLQAQISTLNMQRQRERRDMVDYYLLWAHQIKTPIAAMHLLLQDGRLDREALRAELFKTEQYVQMVLSYLRLDSESNDLVLHSCALDDVVRQALRNYSCIFIQKKLPLKFEAGGTKVLSDEKWLLFVIEQLLSNALKYTNSGAIRVQTEGERLCIQDTGIGIRPEDLPRVFEKGFTGYNGRAEKKSTGIGLYLCKRVCDLLGHRLSLISAPGQGTCAVLDLSRRELHVE